MQSSCPLDLPAKIQYHLDDLEEVAEVVEIWLQSMTMTYSLHSALKAVWSIVDAEVQAIRKEFLVPDRILPSILDVSSYLNQMEVAYPAISEAIDSNTQCPKSHNGKRARTPDEDKRVIANAPHHLARPSPSTQKSLDAIDVVWNHISQPPINNFGTKKLKPDSPHEVCPSSPKSCCSSSKSMWMDTVMFSEPSSSDETQGSFRPGGKTSKRQQTVCSMYGTIRIPRSETPSSDNEAHVPIERPSNLSDVSGSKDQVLDEIIPSSVGPTQFTARSSKLSKQTISKRQQTVCSMYGAIRIPRSETPPSDYESHVHINRPSNLLNALGSKDQVLDELILSSAEQKQSTALSSKPSNQTISKHRYMKYGVYGAIRIPRSKTPPSDDEAPVHSTANNKIDLDSQPTSTYVVSDADTTFETPCNTSFTTIKPQLLIKGPLYSTHKNPSIASGQLSTANYNSISTSGQSSATDHNNVSHDDKEMQANDELGSTKLTTLSITHHLQPLTAATLSSPPCRRLPDSDNTSLAVSVVDISSRQSQVSSQPQPLAKSSLWLQKIAIYQSISVTQNTPQPAELPEIYKATRVLLEALIRGLYTDFDPDELLRQPVSFSSLGQPGIRQWCERPENRELFTPSLETLWYKPENFNFDVIATLDPPDSMPRHERFLWKTLKNFSMPGATFIERGMHYVLAALVLIGSDAEQTRFSQEIPNVAPLSPGARTAFSCWHHYKTLSSLRWAKISAKKAEAATDGCIEDLDKLIATIYTMVETFASIWAFTSLKADIEAAEQRIKECQPIENIEAFTSGLEQLQRAHSQIKLDYSNLPALVGFLCSGVKGLMVYPTDVRVFGPLRAINFLLVTSHLAQCDESISEPVWKRTQSYIVSFLKAVIQPTKEWVPQELNRYYLAKALFLDFSDYCIARNMNMKQIFIPKSRNYKVNDKTYF